MNNLPMGWVEVELEKFVQFAIGGDWGKDIDFDDENFTNVFCIRGAEFRNWEKEKGLTASPRKIKTSSFQTRKLQEDDILIEISGGSPEQPVGRTVLIEPNVFKNIGSDNVVCTNFIRLVRPFKQINSKYLNYYLSLFYKLPEINNYQSGSNNLRNLKFNDYLTILIPTAPKAEQDHIATLLDNHLSQVAKIEQKLKDILPIIKQFRQSVLAQAVSGKLTEDWRESNSENSKIVEFGKEKVKEPLFNIAKNTLPDLPSSWDIYPLGKLSNYVTSGSRGWADYYSDNGAIFFRMSNVRYDTTKLDLNDLQFVNLPDNVEGKRSLIEKDDLIISITADVGRVARIDKDYGEAYINQHLALVRPIKEINAEFLAKCICSQNVGILQVNALKRGATKAGLGLDDIRSLAIPVPPLPEQQQIVAEVERLFAVADTIETQVNEALERVSHLTQSILHQAFTGNLSADWRACNAELITGEHSATALLAQLNTQKAVKKTKKHHQ